MICYAFDGTRHYGSGSAQRLAAREEMPLAAAVSLPSPTPGPREPRLRRTLDAVHRPSPPHCPHRRPPAGLAQVCLACSLLPHPLQRSDCSIFFLLVPSADLGCAAQIMEDVEATARGRVSQHHRHERGSRGLRALRRRRPRAPALRGNPWAQGVWCRRCPTASCSRYAIVVSVHARNLDTCNCQNSFGQLFVLTV